MAQPLIALSQLFKDHKENIKEFLQVISNFCATSTDFYQQLNWKQDLIEIFEENEHKELFLTNGQDVQLPLSSTAKNKILAAHSPEPLVRDEDNSAFDIPETQRLSVNDVPETQRSREMSVIDDSCDSDFFKIQTIDTYCGETQSQLFKPSAMQSNKTNGVITKCHNESKKSDADMSALKWNETVGCRANISARSGSITPDLDFENLIMDTGNNVHDNLLRSGSTTPNLDFEKPTNEVKECEKNDKEFRRSMTPDIDFDTEVSCAKSTVCVEQPEKFESKKSWFDDIFNDSSNEADEKLLSNAVAIREIQSNESLKLVESEPNLEEKDEIKPNDVISQKHFLDSSFDEDNADDNKTSKPMRRLRIKSTDIIAAETPDYDFIKLDPEKVAKAESVFQQMCKSKKKRSLFFDSSDSENSDNETVWSEIKPEPKIVNNVFGTSYFDSQYIIKEKKDDSSIETQEPKSYGDDIFDCPTQKIHKQEFKMPASVRAVTKTVKLPSEVNEDIFYECATQKMIPESSFCAGTSNKTSKKVVDVASNKDDDIFLCPTQKVIVTTKVPKTLDNTEEDIDILNCETQIFRESEFNDITDRSKQIINEPKKEDDIFSCETQKFIEPPASIKNNFSCIVPKSNPKTVDNSADDIFLCPTQKFIEPSISNQSSSVRPYRNNRNTEKYVNRKNESLMHGDCSKDLNSTKEDNIDDILLCETQIFIEPKPIATKRVRDTKRVREKSDRTTKKTKKNETLKKSSNTYSTKITEDRNSLNKSIKDINESNRISELSSRQISAKVNNEQAAINHAKKANKTVDNSSSMSKEQHKTKEEQKNASAITEMVAERKSLRASKRAARLISTESEHSISKRTKYKSLAKESELKRAHSESSSNSSVTSRKRVKQEKEEPEDKVGLMESVAEDINLRKNRKQEKATSVSKQASSSSSGTVLSTVTTSKLKRSMSLHSNISDKSEKSVDTRVSTRLKSSIKPQILFTKIDRTPYIQTLQALGATVVDTPEDCTMLVTSQIYRTAKFLSCVAKGVPIISNKWVTALKAEKRWIDPHKYALIDKENEKLFKVDLLKSLKKAAEKPIFENFTIYVTPNTKPTPEELNQIISCAHGKCILDLKKSCINSNDQIIAVSSLQDKKYWTQLRKMHTNIQIISTEGFMRVVFQQDLNYKKYLLID